MSFFATTKLSSATIQLYDTRISKWLEIVPQHSIEYIILFPRQAIQRLVTHLKSREAQEGHIICTRANIRNYITSIVAVLRYSPHIFSQLPDRITYHAMWTSIIREVAKPIHDRQIQERPTENQEKRGGSKLSFADLVAKRDGDNLSMYQRLLLAMYTIIYPVRADYYSTEIVKGDAEPKHPNYIRIRETTTELVVRDFKTARFFPVIHYPQVPNALHKIIVESLQEKPRTFLFESSDGNPYKRNRFSQWASATLESIFGVKLNLTILRHHFISSLSMDMPLEELQRIGNLMGHSIARQRLYKWRQTGKREEEVDACQGSDEEGDNYSS
jgi:hypothetical protein